MDYEKEQAREAGGYKVLESPVLTKNTWGGPPGALRWDVHSQEEGQWSCIPIAPD